jgi:hypothetical protein
MLGHPRIQINVRGPLEPTKEAYPAGSNNSARFWNTLRHIPGAERAFVKDLLEAAFIENPPLQP